MSKLIIENRSKLSDAVALRRCATVVEQGRVKPLEWWKNGSGFESFEDFIFKHIQRLENGDE